MKYLYFDYIYQYIINNELKETIFDTYKYFHYFNYLKANKQNYENKIVIYLIEQQTARLFIKDNKNSGEFYQLHNDKKALTLIKDKLINVNYLVYVNLDEIEILDISKIDSLIENAKEYKNIIGGRLIEISLINSIDL